MRAYNLRSALQKPEFVTGLYLNRMELKEVPPEVFRLPNLRELDLSFNHIETLPEEIGGLISLEKLALSCNRIAHLPLALGKLRALREIRLDHNAFAAWPEVLHPLTRLENLNLSHNVLETIPGQSIQMEGIRAMDLSFNRLRKLPPSIGRCTTLRTLILRHNRIGHLPAAIAAWRELDHLDLAQNRLRDLPADIGRLENLRLLDISENRFARLPDVLFSCRHLRHLAAAGNRIVQLSPDIARLSWLAHLDLSRNKLQQLPGQLSDCGQLQALLLEKNQLETIPPLSSLSRLRHLDLSRNQLRTWPALPSGLQIYLASHNALQECPSSIGDQSALERLDLSHNAIPALPESLTALQQLQYLDLRKTALEHWPALLVELDHLQTLKTDWPVGRHKTHFRLLRACKGMAVPGAVRRDLYRLLEEGPARAGNLSLRTLFWAINLKYPELRRLARSELFRRRGSPAVGLGPGTWLCVLGKTAFGYRSLADRLQRQSVDVTSELLENTTVVLLGEWPGWSPMLDHYDGVFLSESQVIGWLDEREARYLRSGAGDPELEHLRQLLLHPDDANVQLAVQMMQGGGVPPDLLTEVFIAWKIAKGGKLRALLRRLLWQYTPEPARGVLEMPVSLSPNQPESLLRTNIARLCDGTPFDEEKILRKVLGE